MIHRVDVVDSLRASDFVAVRLALPATQLGLFAIQPEYTEGQNLRYNAPDFVVLPEAAPACNDLRAGDGPSHATHKLLRAASPSTGCASDFTPHVTETDSTTGPESIQARQATLSNGAQPTVSTRKKKKRSTQHRRPRYISSALPFPQQPAENFVNSREIGASYMQSEVDKSEVQNVHNAYMSVQTFTIATRDALALRDHAHVRVIAQLQAPRALHTVADVLAAVATAPEWVKHQAMLRTTAGHLSEMLGQPADRVPIDQLTHLISRFKDHLRGRQHARNGVRSYTHYLRLLIRAADELGAKAVAPEIPASWQSIYQAARAIKCGKVVVYAVEKGLEPAAFGDKELEAWAQAATARGLSFSRTRVVRHLFRKAIFDAGLNSLMPSLTRHRRETYGTPVRQFPSALRSEVEEMMRFKQANFVADAKGKRTKLRPASARTVTEALGRIYGLSLKQGRQIPTLDELVSQPVITAFAEFCLNERKLRPDPVQCALGAVRAAYTQFRGVDLPWFRNLLRNIPKEPRRDIANRKLKKWVEYSVLAEIPAKIRAAAEQGRYSGTKLAIMRQYELLMSILTLLGWRQRNLREPRLGGRADGANIFKGEVGPLSTCARPDWALAFLAENPHTEFWQAHFSADETKAHREIELILPRNIATLLEEWVQVHRPLLVQGADPGTLFLNTKGRAMTSSRMTSTVGELTLRYAGRRVSPHIVRDILVVGFLKDNPEHYELAAKLLWHSTPAMIRERYGRNFDESFGAVAAEEWHLKRKKKAE